MLRRKIFLIRGVKIKKIYSFDIKLKYSILFVPQNKFYFISIISNKLFFKTNLFFVLMKNKNKYL